MRTDRLALAFLLSALVMGSGSTAGEVTDPGGPRYANNVLGDFVTPTAAPGDEVRFAFNLTNPYTDENASMADITLTVSIYMYATEEKNVYVDGAFPHPPLILGNATGWTGQWKGLLAGVKQTISLQIETSSKTPHGSYFSQSTYFVSFNLTFSLSGNATPVVLKSRGCFTTEQWDHIVSFEGNESIVNRTYLKSLGVDGLIPDSSFGLKIPIPRWPLAVIIAGGVGLSLLATYYYVLDNPGRYPKLEKRFYQLRGELSELRGKLKHRGGE